MYIEMIWFFVLFDTMICFYYSFCFLCSIIMYITFITHRHQKFVVCSIFFCKLILQLILHRFLRSQLLIM